MKKAIILTVVLISATHPTDFRNYLRYFQANYTQFKGDHINSKKWYHTISALLESPFIAKGHLHLLTLNNDFSTIESLIPKLDHLFKNDTEVQMIFIKALLALNNHTQAHKKIIALNQANKADPEVALLTAQLYMQQNNFKKALSTINAALNNNSKKTTQYVLHFIKSQIHLAMNNKKAALKEVNTSLEFAPQFDKAWLMRAILEEEAGNIPQAIAAYTNFLEKTNTPNEKIQNHLVALTMRYNSEKITPTLNKKATSNLELALALIKQKKYLQALTALNKHLESHPLHTQAKLLKIQLLVELKQENDLLSYLKTVLQQEPTAHVWYDLIYLLSKKNISPLAAIDILKEVTTQDTHHILPLIYLSHLYSDLKDNHNAIDILQKLITLTNETKIKRDALFKLACIYKNQKNYNQMEKCAHSGNLLDQNHAPFLHLLSYAHTKNGKTDEAKKYITQALKLDKNNTQYLNQLAHIYEQKNLYYKAITTLEKALDCEPNNIKILTHLTKIFTTQGLTDRAITTLTKALATTTNQDDKIILEQQLQALRALANRTTQQAMQESISKI